jgi:hypothetical protein
MTHSPTLIDIQLDGLTALLTEIRALPVLGWSLLAAAGQNTISARSDALALARREAGRTGRSAILRYAMEEVKRSAPASAQATTSEILGAIHVVSCAITAMIMSDVLSAPAYIQLLEPITTFNDQHSLIM